MDCCTSAGCKLGIHGPLPLGQPLEIQVSPYVTYYVSPIYTVGPHGELLRKPLAPVDFKFDFPEVKFPFKVTHGSSESTT